MHPWHKRDLTRWMRVQAQAMNEAADRLEKRPPEPLSWSVAWGPSGILLDERRLTATEVENVVAGGIWAMFESCRDGADACDPKAFERVMQRIEELARERCHQAPPKRTTDR
jgi:hypothetical protein